MNRSGSPWASPPGGGKSNGSGRGPTPPDVDKIIREFQDKIKNFLPGGKSSSTKSLILGLIILAFVWLASGLYRVLPDEQGVVLRFGKFVNTTQRAVMYVQFIDNPAAAGRTGGPSAGRSVGR